MEIYVDPPLGGQGRECGCSGCQCGTDRKAVKFDRKRMSSIVDRWHNAGVIDDEDVDLVLATLRELMDREAEVIRLLSSEAAARYAQTEHVGFARGVEFAIDLLERKFDANA